MDQARSVAPDDGLVEELVETGRIATPDEIERIVERMATAPFNPDPVRVPAKDQGATYQGRALGAREPSALYHLVKRVVIEDLLVVYSARRGIIRTGYQFSTQEQLNLPMEVRWLG